MRKLAGFLTFLGILFIGSGLIFHYQIQLQKKYELAKKNVPIIKQNDYYRDYDFNYVKRIYNANPNNYQELLDLIYSVLNSGYTDFSFYCGDEYSNCLSDVERLGSDQETLSTINNYVHAYNSFENIKILYTDDGNIKFEFKKYYSDDDIKLINSKLDSIFNSLYLDNDTKINNIRRIHDYIINNTKYDSNRVNNDLLDYKSNVAYGTLLEGYAVCGGYSDAMQLFLDKMGIKNFKVASSDHVWNAVYLDGNWYHLDLTWDDPVVSDGSDYLDYSYFLINTNKLLEQDSSQHAFNKDSYTELKSS